LLNQEVEQASASLNQLLEKTAHANTDIASMLTGVLTLGGTFVDIQGSIDTAAASPTMFDHPLTGNYDIDLLKISRNRSVHP